MTVSADAVTRPQTPPNPRMAFTEKDKDKVGVLTSTGLSIMNNHHKAINGLTPTISCNCTNVANVYTLTPLNVSPNVAQYYSFMSFAFVASATSTGLITATVVPNTGALATLKVYKTNGSAQATVGDIVVNLFYLVYYVDTLDSGNGGLVLK